MKADIIDADALRAISPAALSAYARGEGWSRLYPFGDHADVYAGENLPEVILPRTAQLSDYPNVVSGLLKEFSSVAGRDELATYRDLIGADRDVVRVRSQVEEDDGTVDLESGVRMVAQARDMLLAAACAVKSPQALYRAGANKEAIEYMRRVRLGQTEHGSFVVTLFAPVPPMLQQTLDAGWAPLADEPLERKVTRRLVEALYASRNAAELASMGEGNAFESAVSKGVSANLCEALAGLLDQSQRVEISITWARTRPAPERSQTISFTENDAGILREAARTFRLKQPIPDVTLFGTVHKLRRELHHVDGVVTLKALIDEKPQSIQAVLDQGNYSVAVRAHDAKSPIMVTGDLERVGQRWQLTNGSVTEISLDDLFEDGSNEGGN